METKELKQYNPKIIYCKLIKTLFKRERFNTIFYLFAQALKCYIVLVCNGTRTVNPDVPIKIRYVLRFSVVCLHRL